MASTLAESLLDDLDDLSDLDEGEDEVEVEVENNEVGAQKAEAPGRSSSTGAANADDDGDADMNSASITGEASGSGSGPGSASATTIFKKKRRLVDDPKLQLHLKAIQTSLDANANTNNNANYNLMTACNKYLIAVQNELIQTHGDIILAYKPKFPELEELLPDAMAYKNAIKVLQNELDITLVTEQLMTDAHLTSNQIITLSVASSTTVGESLTSSQLAHVNHCISYFEQVLHIKSHLLGYIEVHMESMAPNTCILIGPTLAARIVATAGGMAELSRIPACNLQVLGQVRATAASRAGLSTSIAMASATSGAANSNLLGAPNMAMNMNMHMPRPSKPHEGMISESELYRRVPPPLQRKALKVICAKLALAIRCDYVNLTSGRKNSTESGMKFRAEIERKFAKLIEPDLAPVNKALPKPDMETKKRRGGKRMRLIKEKFAETEMMKQAIEPDLAPVNKALPNASNELLLLLVC
eukprot:CAMPEP_0194125262 /NCGR_PEP_ID=MMETSP0150-20130528/59368_1 /TAXON_ID=122233 /ORGANISM="Chaetoceros debilis, Strain MM31A-1" /LENGTH=472 /DNA_ID=CAMNT_0038819061 /DNA_START=21 /DNA_END=1439 /DNA_ORIENTATION=+